MNYNYYQSAPNADYLEKANDRKILRAMGIAFGCAGLAYFVLTFGVSFAVSLIRKLLPAAEEVFSSRLGEEAYSVIGSIFFIALPFSVSHLFLKKKKLTGLLPFGTSYNKKASAYIVGFICPAMMLTTTAVNFISAVIQNASGMRFTSGMEDMSLKTVPEAVMAVISMALVPAVVEEIAVRGIIMQPLRRYGDKFAIVASALIFSMLHGNMVQIPYALFAGMYLGWAVIATGSLWPSIIIHFLNNLYSVVIMFAENYGEKAVSLCVTVIFAVYAVVGIISIFSYRRMNYGVKLSRGVNTLTGGEKASALFLNVPMVIMMIAVVFITSKSVIFTR